MGVGEIQERTATTAEELTEDDLVGMSASEPGPGDGKKMDEKQCQRVTDTRQWAGGTRFPSADFGL